MSEQIKEQERVRRMKDDKLKDLLKLVAVFFGAFFTVFLLVMFIGILAVSLSKGGLHCGDALQNTVVFAGIFGTGGGAIALVYLIHVNIFDELK
jgi:hypothetical protein